MRKLLSIIVVLLIASSLVCGLSHARSKYSRPKRVEHQKSAPAPAFRSVDAERVLSRNPDPLVEDHLWYYRGVKLLNEGKADRAEKLFLDIIGIHPGSVWAGDARLKLAEVLIEETRSIEAEEQLKAYLKGEPNQYDAFEANLLLGKAYIGLGSALQAIDHFKRMALGATEEARLAQVKENFDELDRTFGAHMYSWLQRPDVQYRIAESFFEASQWDEAAKRVRTHVLNENPSPELRRKAEFLHAKGLARTHHYDEAVSIFEKLRREGGHFPGLSHWLARTYAKQNKYDKAIAIRRTLVKRYGRSRSAANFLAKIAFLYVDQGKYAQAKKEWNEVIAMKPRGKNLMFAKWYLAWCHYRLKEYDQAIAIFDWMLAHNAKRYKFRDRVRYWKARAFIESGRKGEGRALLRQVRGRSGYYGELARRRLNGEKRTFQDFARGSRQGGSSHPASHSLPEPTAIQGQSVHAARAIVLDRLGLPKLAAKEVRAAEEEKSSVDAMILLELARRTNAHDVGRRIAVRRFYPLLKRSPSGGGQSRYIWEQAYPEAYPMVVEHLTSTSPVDEKLVWSIMKAESNFRPHVVSPAGAIGLMQLMPSTARRLAHSGNYDSRKLFEPEINIDFGTKYLSEKLWKEFPGDHVAIIASYNAGEEAVARWLANKPFREDIELFVEEIPYKETNHYVRRVLSNYWVMQRLYD